MTDLIKQAEALEQQAIAADNEARNKSSDAAGYRIRAAKLREQVKEPRELWLNFRAVDGQKLVLGAYETPTADCVRFREVRPVRITDEQLDEAMRVSRNASGFGGVSRSATRAAMEYALSLAGVEVEK